MTGLGSSLGLGFLSLAGAALVGGCASPGPVGERVEVSPGVYHRREIVRPAGSLEPVGEFSGVPPVTRPFATMGGPDRYYNPMGRNWERPWPYGPYGTGNWR